MERELKLLLRRNCDGYEGYSFASKSIRNENFKNFLETYARQRKQYADEIKSEMAKRNITGGNNTSILGDIHEALLKLQKSVSGLDDQTILEECARGESQALVDYEKVLKSNEFPPDLQKLVMRHHDKIRAAKQTLHKLATVI